MVSTWLLLLSLCEILSEISAKYLCAETKCAVAMVLVYIYIYIIPCHIMYIGGCRC